MHRGQTLRLVLRMRRLSCEVSMYDGTHYYVCILIPVPNPIFIPVEFCIFQHAAELAKEQNEKDTIKKTGMPLVYGINVQVSSDLCGSVKIGSWF